MSNANKILPGQKGHGAHIALLSNADQLWRMALRDSKDGKKIVNADGTLRHEDHRQIIDKLVEVRRRELNGIADLMRMGLTRPEDLGTMLVGTENINEFQAAQRSMNPTKGTNNDTNFTLSYTPLPITHQDWSIAWRQNGMQYKNSAGLAESVRQVSESLEDMLFNGASDIRVSIDGATPSQIHGYTSHPNRVTAGISDWTDLVTNGTKVIPETLSLVKQAFSSNASGRPDSLMMYVGNDIWTNLQEDYSANKGDRTYLERIKAISEIADVKPAEKLSSKDVVLVEMSDRTIELAVASDIVTVPHTRTSPVDDQVFTTYAAMVPIIKSDRNSATGIVHGVEAL